MTNTITSADGTKIAFETTGHGPPLILVDGALCSRDMGPMPDLVPLLADHFTVFNYDRRGRNESGNAGPYAIEREIEDIDALISVAGGPAHVYGVSSGAILALDAAEAGLAIERLALYEAPVVVDDSRDPAPPDYLERMQALVAADRRSDALKQFMRLVGMPRPMLALMPLLPMWRKLKAVAPTLVHDATIMEGLSDGKSLPADRWASVTAPTLVGVGGKSPAFFQNGSRALADLLVNADHHVVPGQTHMLKAKAIAPVLIEFLAGSPASVRSAPSRSSAPAPASAPHTPVA